MAKVKKKPSEADIIRGLMRELCTVLDGSDANDGHKTVAALIVAAMVCRQSKLPRLAAGRMLETYIDRDPI